MKPHFINMVRFVNTNITLDFLSRRKQEICLAFPDFAGKYPTPKMGGAAMYVYGLT